ncbi:hypothetical protein O181_045321 [Austropuccinia psidii MF-1]|uniref:Integrase catalytic domain-containing protein n=1 Tax=Austropuccinia psidii MF-1 TaxID=1389203 RepID=A0A9Q3DK11_9BASI|nr:hypothetical protein [Austropuccinia psidii MF-1]
MDGVIALPPGGEKIYNACLVILDRYSKNQIFLTFHRDETAIDTALSIWNRVISQTGISKNIIRNRDSKFTSDLWKNLPRILGIKISFSTAHHPQTDGLAGRIIQNLEYIIKRLCGYGLEFEDSDGFTNHWCTLIPELELA